MVYGLWQSAAGLQVQDYRQAIITNNLANAETPGFKADRVAFQERLNAAAARGELRGRHPVFDAMTGGVFETDTYTDFTQGGIVPSNNPLDVAVNGAGFLAVQTDDGPRYTRDGRLIMNRDGTLVHSASGSPVTDSEGRLIVLDADSRAQVRIDESGRVRQGDFVAGRLALVDFADRRRMTKTGENLFAVDQAQPIAASGRIKQHAYEASGVEPVSALVEMIAATRAYETNARMISLQDESLGRTVTELGRIA